VSDTAVLVFARAPVPGRVKTRLLPGLSAVQAARLYTRMLDRALACARESALGPVTLWCTPDTDCPRLVELARRHGAKRALQRGDDLGARMHGALACALREHRAALLLGSDCPGLRAGTLVRAAQALRQGLAAVFVPAVDGGYVLVGSTRAEPALFRDIPWGSHRVMTMTRERLTGLDWRWLELEPHRDVDRVQDLDLLPPGFGSGTGIAPIF
jgi:rSAM/selenodomain-associated transferase 1